MNTILKKIHLLLCVAVLLSVMSGCTKEDYLLYEENTEVRSVTGFLKNNFDLSLFYAALEKTNLLDEIDSRTEMTVFAPDNSAFNALGIYTASDFDKLDADSLRFMLRYHILKEVLIFSDIPDRSVDSEYENLEGIELIVSKGQINSRIYVNGVATTYRDIQLSNGIVHIISSALKYKNSTVQEWLAENENYTCFVAGLKKFGLWEQLSDEGPWLVAVVENSVFAGEGITQQDIENMDISQYGARLFSTYVFKPRIFLSDLDAMGSASGPSWESFSITVPSDPLFKSSILWNRDRTKFQLRLSSSSSLVSESQNSKTVNFSADYAVNYVTNNGVIHRVEGLVTSFDETPPIK